MPSFGSPAVGTSGAEEAAGAEGVIASKRPVAVTGADGDGEIVAAFGIVGAGAIATASGVVIDGGPEAVGWTGEGGGADVPRGSLRSQQEGCLGYQRANHGGLPPSAIATSRGSC